MAITCPKCGSQFDATLFQFGHRVRCSCGAEVEHPGKDQRGGHVVAQGDDKAVSHEDRCVGSLLGTACGDILGAAVEGMAASEIRSQYGEVRDFIDTGRGYGRYTDDTQMTLALAASLVNRGRVNAAHVSAKYAEFYQSWRGYGGAAHRVMRLLADGGDYRGTGRLQFPDGSFGNGGAMRIAPVGLAYRNADAVNFGGDTDTIGAMTGALVGALHGSVWIPAR